MRNIQEQHESINTREIDTKKYDHYIAVDWSMRTMAIARMTGRMVHPKVMERATDVRELKEYLQTLRGRKILTIEETTGAQWLYVELHDSVDRILVCDPYRNRLLSDGPKTDKIDAEKLCVLLKAGLLKEVYHTLESDYRLRSLVSAYEDVVKAGVRLQNQRAAVYRGEGAEQDRIFSERKLQFIVNHIDGGLQLYHQTVADYEVEFTKLSNHNRRIKRQMGIPGIGLKGAVKIIATVLSVHRFSDKGHYLSYCGLVNHQKTSGGRSYGYRKPRYNHTLKAVYKTAALAALRGNNTFHEHYDHLRAKGVTDYNARHAVARMIATISFGMLKNDTVYQAKEKQPAATNQTTK